jgi:hypothetical protein
MEQEKHTFDGQKGKNKASEPENAESALKLKTSRHFKKCMLEKFCRTQKKKNKLEILESWSNLKEKKQDCLQVFYSYHETKLLGVYFNHISFISIFTLKIQ